MTEALWFIAFGVLIVSLTLLTPLLHRLPISISMVHLLVGLLLGPMGLGILRWDIIRDARLFELATELTVIVSLFTVGLTMRRAIGDRLWLLPVRLATTTMILTIIAVAVAGYYLLGLPLGAGVLLGAILAPTDPVLATDVQLQEPTDEDALRYSISGEAGLNDGTAFPFVMLGLGLLGLHSFEDEAISWLPQSFSLLNWIGWDLVWAVCVGLAVGALCGWVVGHAALLMQRRLSNAFSLHELLVLGLIALAYGMAELAYGYGFLAVFAAGYALRYIELHSSDHAPMPAELPAITPGSAQETLNEELQDQSKAANFLAVSLRDFNDKLEHLLMSAVVVLIGSSLSFEYLTFDVLWFAPLLFLLLRPVAVALGLLGAKIDRVQTGLIGWFGIRGIGSLYYLSYAIEHGLPEQLAQRIASLVLSMIVISILVHGISVTPLMNWYEGRQERRTSSDEQPQPISPQASS
jgi:sodium/hydrogen antiporter